MGHFIWSAACFCLSPSSCCCSVAFIRVFLHGSAVDTSCASGPVFLLCLKGTCDDILTLELLFCTSTYCTLLDCPADRLLMSLLLRQKDAKSPPPQDSFTKLLNPFIHFDVLAICPSRKCHYSLFYSHSGTGRTVSD